MDATSKQKEKMGYIELISAMSLSGTIGMFVVFSKQPIINVVFYRCAIGFICLLIYVFLNKTFKRQLPLSKKQYLWVAVVGVSVVLNWLALFSAYSYTSIGIATTIYHIQPIIVFFAGAFIFQEKIKAFRILWLALVFLGVVLIINPPHHSMMAQAYFKGSLLAFFAACLYSVATLATKAIQVASPYVIAVAQMLIGILILAPFVKLSIVPETPLQIGSILILGIVHSAFMYILLYSSYQKLPTSSIAILSYIYPLVAVAIDYIVFNRRLSLLQITGGLMILIAGLCNKLDINPFKLTRKIIK